MASHMGYGSRGGDTGVTGVTPANWGLTGSLPG